MEEVLPRAKPKSRIEISMRRSTVRRDKQGERICMVIPKIQ